MAETLLQYQTSVQAPDGTVYTARACGRQIPDGLWEGWIEFDPVDGGTTIQTARETTQPNRTDIEYWATGLTPVYIDGALQRTLQGAIHPPTVRVRPPAFDMPAPPSAVPLATNGTPRSVLDPFSVYEKGESLLRKQLAALSAWHLVNIIVEYQLSDEKASTLNAMTPAALIDDIVQGVRRRLIDTLRAR